MQENAICFISKCIVYHLFLHQTAGYTETVCLLGCCTIRADKMGEICTVLMQVSSV